MWCPHPLVTSEGTLQVIKIRGIPTTSSFGLSYAKREARERGVKPSGSTQVKKTPMLICSGAFY